MAGGLGLAAVPQSLENFIDFTSGIIRLNGVAHHVPVQQLVLDVSRVKGSPNGELDNVI